MQAAGRRGLELRRQMASQRAASELQIAAGRDHTASAAAAYRAALLSARSRSHQTLSHQEELTRLKGRFRELEAHLAQALSIKVSKDSECELTKESISSTAAINEHLKNLFTDQRNKRDQFAAVVSNQLEAVEALEAKSNENETWRKNIEEAAMWYHKFLGFQVVRGEGVKFVFNKVDLKSPGEEYTFSIRLDKDRYNWILPVSSVVCTDASSIAVSSPVVMSVDARNENVANQCYYQIKNKKHALPTKRRAAALSVASPGVVSSVRRSPRFVGIR